MSSWLAAVCSERRRANGLRASSVMRLLADSMPITAPSASSTGRWFTPEAIMAMLASGASTSAAMVWTGVVMMLDGVAARIARMGAENRDQPGEKGADQRQKDDCLDHPRTSPSSD